MCVVELIEMDDILPVPEKKFNIIYRKKSEIENKLSKLQYVIMYIVHGWCKKRCYWVLVGFYICILTMIVFCSSGKEICDSWHLGRFNLYLQYNSWGFSSADLADVYKFCAYWELTLLIAISKKNPLLTAL